MVAEFLGEHAVERGVAIEGIESQSMMEECEVLADLMMTTCLNNRFDEARIDETLQHAIARLRRHRPLSRTRGERQTDDAGVAFETSRELRLVGFFPPLL